MNIMKEICCVDKNPMCNKNITSQYCNFVIEKYNELKLKIESC
jgi:hypothetical protein